MNKGYTGISFPFRVGIKGGVSMSTTNEMEATHIIESMKQILLTRPKERGMEHHFYSDIDSDIFEPNDASTHTIIAYQIQEALRELEDRIEITSIDITSVESAVMAEINFKVLDYDTLHTTTLKVGDTNV